MSKLNHLIRPQINWGPEVSASIESTEEILQQLGYTIEQIMLEVMQPCAHLLRHCHWLRREVPCDTIFQIAKSAEGFCCSFNYGAIGKKLLRYLLNEYFPIA